MKVDRSSQVVADPLRNTGSEIFFEVAGNGIQQCDPQHRQAGKPLSYYSEETKDQGPEMGFQKLSQPEPALCGPRMRRYGLSGCFLRTNLSGRYGHGHRRMQVLTFNGNSLRHRKDVQTLHGVAQKR